MVTGYVQLKTVFQTHVTGLSCPVLQTITYRLSYFVCISGYVSSASSVSLNKHHVVAFTYTIQHPRDLRNADIMSRDSCSAPASDV